MKQCLRCRDFIAPKRKYCETCAKAEIRERASAHARATYEKHKAPKSEKPKMYVDYCRDTYRRSGFKRHLWDLEDAIERKKNGKKTTEEDF